MTTHLSLSERVSKALEQHLQQKLGDTFTSLERGPGAGPSEVARINGTKITATTLEVRNAIIESLVDAGVSLRQIYEEGTDIWSLMLELEDSEGFGQILVTYKRESHELIASVISGLSTTATAE